jgi:hypothetical protein
VPQSQSVKGLRTRVKRHPAPADDDATGGRANLLGKLRLGSVVGGGGAFCGGGVAVGLAGAFGLGLEFFEGGGVDDLPVAAGVPGAAGVGFAAIAGACGVVEILVDEFGCGRNRADREAIDAHAFEGGGERLHVGDFARHQELEGADGAGVVGEVDEAFVDDFGAGFGGDVAAEIDVEFARDFEIVGGPSVAH